MAGFPKASHIYGFSFYVSTSLISVTTLCEVIVVPYSLIEKSKMKDYCFVANSAILNLVNLLAVQPLCFTKQ